MKLRQIVPAVLLASLSPVLAAMPAHADSTRTIAVSVSPEFCPDAGLYGIARVVINGGGNMVSNTGFPPDTRTAVVAVPSVPASGARASVIAVYTCNVRVLWWVIPGNERTASGSRWIEGSGAMQSIVLTPQG